MEIRDYRETDWDALCRVHDLARPMELSGSCDPGAFIPLAQDEEAKDLKRCRIWVACDGEMVVGFVAHNADYLAWLYLDPAYHGRGIGRGLLRHALRFMGPTTWTISLAGNLPALRLYESEGFVVVRTCEGDNAGFPCTSYRLERKADAARETPGARGATEPLPPTADTPEA